jgi:hypothetical protein
MDMERNILISLFFNFLQGATSILNLFRYFYFEINQQVQNKYFKLVQGIDF